jgi:hypothetical protein
VVSASCVVVRLLAGALCCGGTSESVCILREMAAGEVGHLWLLYPGVLVVVVETEVPTTCFRVYGTLVWLFALTACCVSRRIRRLRSVLTCCRSGL